jgi:hypothetical protein
VSAISREDDGRLALLTIDQPDAAVNTLTRAVGEELLEQLARIQTDAAVDAVVLLSGKPDVFIAGADIRELASLASPAEGTRLSTDAQRMMDDVPACQLAHRRDRDDLPAPVAVGHVQPERPFASWRNLEAARAGGPRLPAGRRDLATRRAPLRQRRGEPRRQAARCVEQRRDRVAERASSGAAVDAVHSGSSPYLRGALFFTTTPMR